MLALSSFSVSWVDFLVLCLLFVGVFRGRKRGMSEELLDIIKWSLIVVIAGLLHEPVGRWLAQVTVFSLLFSYLFTYVLIAVFIYSSFTLIRRKVGDKLTGSDAFGSAEYYLGMMAGAYRYFCVLLVAMALLNARHYSAAEIAAKDKYQDQNFGTKLIPTLPDIQKEVFDRSLSGRVAFDYLHVVLIRSTAPSDKSLRGGNTIVHARESALDQILEK